MKTRIIYLIPLLLALATGCIKNAGDPTPDQSTFPYPLGTFIGKFTRIHTNTATAKTDTATCNLQLVLSTSTGYAVMGDTSTIHAGSYGSFSENSALIHFDDITYPLDGSFPVKTHLEGTYDYTFDGTIFKITGTDGDSLSYNYTLIKSSN